jgi:hypothetical protein
VGSNAVYRREALKETGGTAEVGASEDVYTGTRSYSLMLNIYNSSYPQDFLPLAVVGPYHMYPYAWQLE